MISFIDSICTFLFEPQQFQPCEVSGCPIRLIPADILECIIIFTNQSKNTRLVSRHWNDLTFLAFKNSKKLELKQTIRLITEHLDPRKDCQCIAELAKIDDYQSLSVATFIEDWRLFLRHKNSVIVNLLELTEKKRGQLRNTTESQLPDSMKDVFLRLVKLEERMREHRRLVFTQEPASIFLYSPII